jgi:hypothetical protein
VAAHDPAKLGREIALVLATPKQPLGCFPNTKIAKKPARQRVAASSARNSHRPTKMLRSIANVRFGEAAPQPYRICWMSARGRKQCSSVSGLRTKPPPKAQFIACNSRPCPQQRMANRAQIAAGFTRRPARLVRTIEDPMRPSAVLGSSENQFHSVVSL